MISNKKIINIFSRVSIALGFALILWAIFSFLYSLMLPSACFSTSHSVILLLLEVELCFSTSHSLFWLLLEVELCCSTSHSLFWLLLQVELCSSTSHSRLGLFLLNFPFLLSSTFFFSYTPSCKHSAWFFALASSAFFFAHVSIAVPFCTYFINLLFSVLKFVFQPHIQD